MNPDAAVAVAFGAGAVLGIVGMIALAYLRHRLATVLLLILVFVAGMAIPAMLIEAVDEPTPVPSGPALTSGTP